MGVITGVVYCFLWYSSIFAGYAGLFCPLFPLLLLSNNLYRYLTDTIYTLWQYYPTVLIEKLVGCDVQISGDCIPSSETALLIMNHRTRTDWNYLWPTLYHCIRGPAHHKYSTKFILKDMIRHIPGAGWVMQMACFIYIKRNWQRDREIIRKSIEYFNSLYSYRYALLLFPEGTDFTPKTLQKSTQYAKTHHLPQYHHVLHPRTSGFAHLTETLLKSNRLDAIYDLTIVYPDLVPQSEYYLIMGRFPQCVKIHLTRYPKTVLPHTSEGLKQFLQKKWWEKERILTEYHATGHFLHGNILRRRQTFELYFAFVFWTVLPVLVIWLLITQRWYRLLVIAHTIFLLLINWLMGGYQNFEVFLFNHVRPW